MVEITKTGHAYFNTRLTVLITFIGLGFFSPFFLLRPSVELS